jgi:hypothetical protein
MPRPLTRRSTTVATLFALALALAGPALVSAHEERDVAGTAMEVGFIGEPVFVGNKSGVEVFVNRGDTPVEGLEKTLKVSVTAGGQTRDLPLDARFDTKGAYESFFIPTAAGQYSFHLTGTIEGTAVDETFTSGPTSFGDVEDTSSGQFPVVLPGAADVAANARKGADAAAQLPIAIGLGAAGLVAGLAALGLTLARRRPRS